jgi:hypothetical protein
MEPAEKSIEGYARTGFWEKIQLDKPGILSRVWALIPTVGADDSTKQYNRESRGALRGACEGGHIELVKYILDKDTSLLNTGFREACQSRNKHIICDIVFRDDFSHDNIPKMLSHNGFNNCLEIIDFLQDTGILKEGTVWYSR